jgi:hypothetical protein
VTERKRRVQSFFSAGTWSFPHGGCWGSFRSLVEVEEDYLMDRVLPLLCKEQGNLSGFQCWPDRTSHLPITNPTLVVGWPRLCA